MERKSEALGVVQQLTEYLAYLGRLKHAGYYATAVE
jgi:hypothetical protein